MQTAVQCVLIGMQTKVAGKFCPPAPPVFSVSLLARSRSYHPSIRPPAVIRWKQLHRAASSPPPPTHTHTTTISNTKMTFTSSTCRKMGKDRGGVVCGQKKKEERAEKGGWRCGKCQRRWRCVEIGDVRDDGEREEGEKLHECESENTKTGDVRCGGRDGVTAGMNNGKKMSEIVCGMMAHTKINPLMCRRRSAALLIPFQSASPVFSFALVQHFLR